MMKKNINYYTDENLVRLNALFVIVTVVVALVYQASFLWVFLAIDFAMRALALTYAPLVLLSKFIIKVLKIKPKPIFASPKRFAAALGAVFSAVIFVLLLSGFYQAAVGLGILLILLAGLESFFKICVGCYIYQFLILPAQQKNK